MKFNNWIFYSLLKYVNFLSRGYWRWLQYSKCETLHFKSDWQKTWTSFCVHRLGWWKWENLCSEVPETFFNTLYEIIVVTEWLIWNEPFFSLNMRPMWMSRRIETSLASVNQRWMMRLEICFSGLQTLEMRNSDKLKATCKVCLSSRSCRRWAQTS